METDTDEREGGPRRLRGAATAVKERRAARGPRHARTPPRRTEETYPKKTGEIRRDITR